LEVEPALFERVRELVAARDRLARRLRGLGFAIPDAQGNFVWLPAAERTMEYADAYARAGLMVRPYASGDPGDGIRITVGEPEANERVLEVAATLVR
jgi:histidinol-phosphate aminotransferase